MTQPQTILCPRCHQPGPRRARFCQQCGFDMVLNNAGPRYYITRIVKAGGQGAVYEAVGDDGAVYAVKEMLDTFADPQERAEAVARFEAEARLLERLAHPRIPRVYTHFADEGRHYLAMDFVRGEDLEEVVEREGVIPERRVLDWAAQICDVLGYLHDNGLIYRDMKPSNVMLDHQNGGVKLVDFGIAKVLQAGQRGTQIGTPGYAPPEQYQGLATRESDIFALGATLHHLLTGVDPQARPPFTFPPVRDLNPAVSERTSDAVARALQFKPEDRFHSLPELCDALGLGAAATPSPARAATQAATPSAPPAPAAPVAAASSPPPAVAPQTAPTTAPQPAPAVTAPRRASPPQPAPAASARSASPPQSAPAASPRPLTGGVTCVRTLFTIALVLAALAGLAYVGFGVTAGGWLAPAPTAQTFVQQPYRTEVEIIVPLGTDEDGLRAAFEYSFLELARRQYGAGVQLQPGSVVYSGGGQPVRLSEDAQGVHYRAALEGQILVPQP